MRPHDPRGNVKLEGDLLTRDRGPFASKVRTVPAVVALSTAISLFLVTVASLALDRLDRNPNNWQPVAGIVLSLASAALALRQDLGGKLVPGVYVPTWGRYAWLRAHLWRVALAAMTIGSLTFLTWLVTGPTTAVRQP